MRCSCCTGSTWRIHYSLDLAPLKCDELHVTGIADGESLTRFLVHPGEVIMADRGRPFTGSQDD
jgi:hypothetical protein